MTKNDIRKYLNVINEASPMAPGTFDDPLNPNPTLPSAPLAAPTAPDATTDDAGNYVHDVPATGPVTKIEVTMKDDDEVDVEVLTKQGDELKRLMDLAGLFHKEKQSGTLANNEPEAAPLPAPVQEPAMATPEPVISQEPAGMEPEPTDMPVDVEPSSVDSDLDADIDDSPEGDDEPMDAEFSMGEDFEKKHDYGYPNPDLGQQDYDMDDASGFSGIARKPVRYTPARHGDNALSNNKKSLQAYVQEIADSKKKVLGEMLPPAKSAENVVNAVTSGVKVDPMTKQKLTKLAKERETGMLAKEPDSEKADSVVDAAATELRINPNVYKGMKQNVANMRKNATVGGTTAPTMKTGGIGEQNFALPLVDEDDLDEKKRRYSFSPAEFGRGIVTSPMVKLRKAAKRGMGRK